MSEIVTTQIKPDTQSYLSCDTQGNCCDLETNICQNISYEPTHVVGPPIHTDLNSIGNQLMNWIKSNPLLAGGGLLLLIALSGRRR